MKSAYLYVRVSTDEQKRKGFSLAEQEDRLLIHCEINNIKVKGIFREDFSAKDFNRPEWKKLINVIKRNRHKNSDDILFLKWDRFSRNIEYAYQMIGILRKYNTKAMAIDQPIDFDVPESIVMLAVYLSIPEAENTRRGMNCSAGMRRSRKMGRWPGKAPFGYANMTAFDGKKFIAPKQPEADHIKWIFHQFAKGSFLIQQLRRLALLRGFECSTSAFWKLLRNPVYCGIVTVPENKDEELQFVKGVHEPLISEELFHRVQSILCNKRQQRGTKEIVKSLFPLRGFLICPLCQRTLTASRSKGKYSSYPYYHCTTVRCKGRFRSDAINEAYEKELGKIHLVAGVHELFEIVLEDENIFTRRKEYRDDRKEILDDISKQQLLMSKARKYFLNDKIDFDDFTKLKKEHNAVLTVLNNQLINVTAKLFHCSRNTNGWSYSQSTILQSYKYQDIVGKRNLIGLFTPSTVDPFTRRLDPLKVNSTLSLILEYKGN